MKRIFGLSLLLPVTTGGAAFAADGLDGIDYDETSYRIRGGGTFTNG